MVELVRDPFGAPVSMRKAYGQALVELGHAREDVVVLSADISNSDHSYMFEEAFPDRFFNVGIAEQALVDVAVGLANGDWVPIANTFAFLFATRALEQVRTHLCYGEANVKLAAAYAGLSDSFDGPTHHAITDLAIMRSLPRMTVVVPADPVAINKLLPQVAAWEGPVFFRLCRNEVPVIFTNAYDPEIGKGVLLREGTDVTIIGCGVMVSRCLEAARRLAETGLRARVVEMHTIKPLDRELIAHCAAETGAIVSVEEHSIIGGLGGAVAEALVESEPVPLERVGLVDTFAESGPYSELMDKYGLGVGAIVAAVQRVITRKRR
ncbi:MAG TPA: transketolase family protein [Anaerolineae bacterium]|nr:transketolase family protein [Anaerolineae bacterium]HIQ06032.1 transketolase family protein [Anaerolineae bacterium]